MANQCPECSALVSANATECKKCGADLSEMPPPPPPPKSNDAMQYAVVGGVVIVIAALLFFIGTAMSSKTCPECKGKKYTYCLNCKDGRKKCILCKGTGSDPGTFSTCGQCNGQGVTPICRKCGDNPKKACATCQGSGVVSQ